MLNSKQSHIYCGVSKPTFLKRKIPFSPGARKGYKLYDTKILDQYFPDAPKIMPDKDSHTGILANSPAIEIDISLHQPTFAAILAKVKKVQGETFQHDIAASLVESLIKTSILELHYFTQLQIAPESKDIFSLWKECVNLKMNLSKMLRL